MKKRYAYKVYTHSCPLKNKFGKQFPNEKIAPEQRIELFNRHESGESYKSLSEHYGISTHRCRAICSQIRKAYTGESFST